MWRAVGEASNPSGAWPPQSFLAKLHDQHEHHEPSHASALTSRFRMVDLQWFVECGAGA